MVNAEPRIVEEARRALGWMRLVVLAGAIAGIAALAATIGLVGTPEAILVGVALAALFWGGSAYLHLTWLVDPNDAAHIRRVETTDGVAFQMALRRNLPMGRLVAAVAMVVFFGTAAFVLGSTAWTIVGLLLAVAGLVVLPDACRALTAPARTAVIDSRGLTYCGYSYDVQVHWDDIASGDLDPTSHYPNLRLAFTLRPGSRLNWTRRRWLVQFEPDPQQTQFTIPTLTLYRPRQFLELCTGLAQTAPHSRDAYLISVSERILAEPSRRRP